MILGDDAKHPRAVAMHAGVSVELWHRRLRHVGMKGLEALRKVKAIGIGLMGTFFLTAFAS